MKVSKKGIELIKEFEGFSKKAYECSAKKLTIGYGHVIKDEESNLKSEEITIKKANQLLEEDISHFENYLNNMIDKYKINMNQNQFDALVSFCYNIGF